MVAGVDDDSVVLPNMLKPTVVVGAIEFEAAWPNVGPPGTLVVAVTVAGASFPNWNTGPGAAKLESVLVAELARPPNRNGCDVLVDVAVVTVRLAVGPVEAGGLSPKLKTGLMVASVEELRVVAVVAAVVKMTLGRPANPAVVVVEAAGKSAAEAVCDNGLNVKGEAFAGDKAAVTLPKIGLNMVAVEDVEEGLELADTVTAEEMTAVQGAVLSVFGKAPKIGLKTGAVVGTAVAVVVAGWLAGGVLSVPNKMFGFGKERGLTGVWPSSVNAGATLLGGCAPEAGGAESTGVLNTGTGLVSAEVTGRELNSSDTAAAGGCDADEEGWDPITAPVESGGTGAAWLLCIFFRLSRSELLLGRTGAIDAGAGPGDVTMVTVNASGVDTGIVSAVVLGTGSALSSKTLLNHCNAAFFSASRSSDVTE